MTRTSSVARGTLTIPPGETLRSEPGMFAGALVVVAAGRIAVQAATSGIVMWFKTGDMLVLAALNGALVHNPGRQPARLSVTIRPAAG